MKKLLFLISLISIAPQTHSISPTTAAYTAATSLAAIAGYHYLTTPVKPEISPDNLHIVTFTPASSAPHIKNPIKKLSPLIKSNSPFLLHCMIQDMPYMIHNGMPAADEIVNNTIVIYSGGWIGGIGLSRGYEYRHAGAGAVLAERALKTGFINGTVVTFDYPTDRRASFNFGQHDDLACLVLIYDAVSKAHPNAQIILAGDSMGGAKILNFITHPPQKSTEQTRACQSLPLPKPQQPKSYFHNLKAVILESPPVTLEHVARTNSETLFPALLHRFHPAVYAVYKLYFPNMNHALVHETSFLYANQEAIPNNLPIFLGTVIGDHMASQQDTFTIIETFKKSGNPYIHLFTTTRSVNHAQVGLHGKVPEFPMAVTAFLHQYNLPYRSLYLEQWHELQKNNNRTYTYQKIS